MKVRHIIVSPLPLHPSHPPSPTEYGGTFFVKKLCMREQTVWDKFMGGCFIWGLMIRPCEAEGNGGEVSKVESS